MAVLGDSSSGLRMEGNRRPPKSHLKLLLILSGSMKDDLASIGRWLFNLHLYMSEMSQELGR